MDISHSIGMFYKIPKKIKEGKKIAILIYCISDGRYDLEDLLKSDMDWHERIWIGEWLKVVAMLHLC